MTVKFDWYGRQTKELNCSMVLGLSINVLKLIFSTYLVYILAVIPTAKDRTAKPATGFVWNTMATMATSH
jgi:hypothetical protein